MPRDRTDEPVDENRTKRQGVRPPKEPDDVHGYDTRTASPQGLRPAHDDEEESTTRREGS